MLPLETGPDFPGWETKISLVVALRVKETAKRQGWRCGQPGGDRRHSLRKAFAAARQASLSITDSWNLLKLMSIESVSVLKGRGSLVGCHLWGRTESDMIEVT